MLFDYFDKSNGTNPLPFTAEGVTNTLHYEDAAAACVAALQAGPSVTRHKVYLLSDGQPVARRRICELARQTPHFQDRRMPTFAIESDPNQSGKVYDGSWSNEALNWKPRYESFAKFMEAIR